MFVGYTGSCVAPPVHTHHTTRFTPIRSTGIDNRITGISVARHTQNQLYFADHYHQLTMYSAPPGFAPPPQQPTPPPSGWTEHLFYTNGKGTPAFEALMKEFFVKLDPRATGHITPEAFSSFLEASLVQDTDNVCKSTLRPNEIVAYHVDPR